MPVVDRRATVRNGQPHSPSLDKCGTSDSRECRWPPRPPASHRSQGERCRRAERSTIGPAVLVPSLSKANAFPFVPFDFLFSREAEKPCGNHLDLFVDAKHQQTCAVEIRPNESTVVDRGVCRTSGNCTMRQRSSSDGCSFYFVLLVALRGYYTAQCLLTRRESRDRPAQATHSLSGENSFRDCDFLGCVKTPRAGK